MNLYVGYRLTGIMFGILSLEACLVFSIPTSSLTPHSTFVPQTTATSTGTVAIQAITLPSPSPTQPVLTAEERTSLLQTHEVVVMIQFDTEATSGLAGQIIAGNIPQADLQQSILTMAGLADGTDWVIPFITPSARFQSHWETALAIHMHNRELLEKWVNGIMDSAMVEQEIQNDLSTISRTVEEVEGILVNEYGFDMQLLIEAREQALAGMRGTPEATPTP
jgi:hypothetical protein